jgi:hypothetical protein
MTDVIDDTYLFSVNVGGQPPVIGKPFAKISDVFFPDTVGVNESFQVDYKISNTGDTGVCFARLLMKTGVDKWSIITEPKTSWRFTMTAGQVVSCSYNLPGWDDTREFKIEAGHEE